MKVAGRVEDIAVVVADLTDTHKQGSWAPPMTSKRVGNVPESASLRGPLL